MPTITPWFLLEDIHPRVAGSSSLGARRDPLQTKTPTMVSNNAFDGFTIFDMGWPDGDAPSLKGSHGRYCHSTLPLAVIDGHSLGVCTAK